MKRKDKEDKSNKAKDFIRKYQLGGDYDMQDPYSYLPDLQAAQQAQLVQYNQPKSQSTFIKPRPMSEGFDAIPLINPAINLGIGVKNIIDSFGERKRQKQYERAYRKDLERRMEEARTGDYYRTPYEFEEGGLYPEQDLDFFIDFYNQKEQQNRLQQQAFENYYTQKNEMKESNWRNKQKSGIQSALTGAFDIAKTFVGLPGFQLGGIKPDTLMQRSTTNTPLSQLTADYFNLNQVANKTNEQIDAERASWIWNYKKENPEMFDLLMGLNPERPKPSKSKRFDKWRYEKQEGGEYNPRVDLYSPEYDPNEFLGIENEISEAQIQDKESSTIEQWLFQDEPDVFQEELNLNYFNPEPIGTEEQVSTGVVDKIMQLESGGNPEAVNPTTNATGLFQFVPRYWAGQIKSFMSLPQTFTQEQVMESFKKNPNVQKEFMNHVVNNIYMPEVEKLRPLAKRYGFTDDQVIRLLHYRGIADATRRLKTGDFEVSQEEKAKYGNPDVLVYLNK